MTNQDLVTLIEKIEPDKRELAKRLLDKLEFMEEILKNLQESIKVLGVVDNCGEQVKESPAIKSYNATVKSYAAILKQLEFLLRFSDKNTVNNLQDFITAD